MAKDKDDHTYDIKCSATIGTGNVAGSYHVDLSATALECDTGIALFSFRLSYPGVPDANALKDIWDKVVARMEHEGYKPTITGDLTNSQQTSWHGVSRSALILSERLTVKAMDKIVDLGEHLAKTKKGFKQHVVPDL